MEFWAAFTIGLLGSFHCIGMCGPIALALPDSGETIGTQIIQKTLYNFGRILTYTFFGALFGFVGQGISLAGFQRPLSILLGISIILVILIPKKHISWLQDISVIQPLFFRLRKAIQSLLKNTSQVSLLTIGILNGFLPCGFVYVGLAGSLTTGSIFNGMAFMALFGLGTFPVMMAISLAPGFVSLRMRSRINRFIPYLGIMLGLLLVIRGIFMDVPMSIRPDL